MFEAIIKRRRKGLHGVEEEYEETIKIKESQLSDLSEQWDFLTLRGRKIWLEILPQIDHPLAKKLLMK